MAEVKPAEVSAILKNQLAGFKVSASLDEVGPYLRSVMALLEFTALLMPNTVSWLLLKTEWMEWYLTLRKTTSG